VQVLYDKGLANHIGLEPCEGLREEADEKSVGARVGGVSRRESCLSRAPTLVGGRKATSRSTEPRVLLDLCAVRVPTRGGCHGAASRCLRLPMACWPRTYERIDRWRNAGCGGKPARPGADRDGQRAFLPLDNVPAIPTVSLDVVSLVASSCGHYRGYIEQHHSTGCAVPTRLSSFCLLAMASPPRDTRRNSRASCRTRPRPSTRSRNSS
jgi:hypothetical protein